MDFDDPLDDVLSAPIRPVAQRPAMIDDGAHWEPCRKCGGSGTYRGFGVCFACQGKGGKRFKQSADRRAASREATRARKANTAESNLAEFNAKHVDVGAWLIAKASTFEFAASLLDAVRKYGDLTERQIAAARALVEKDKARAVEREAVKAASVANAADISVQAIETAFATAQSRSIPRPKLRLDAFTFSLATAHGKNAGSLYVKEGDEYLGKITAAKFYATSACGAERTARVIAAAADPANAAKAYGQRFGVCSCCGRTLTKGISIDLGIGPICAEKFGW